MIGKTILHYKILEMLGEGGMGVVYLAEDTRLERKVAIKFLPKLISSDSEEITRFRIEAKAAAALNHPNIATIYAIEEADDQVFLSMEYIEGVELKDKISSSDERLPTKDIINYATQIAEGLEAAHNKGIVHRDIKSQNIMITDTGKVKIMDFGLAKIKGGSQLTKIGTTVGTLAYMSPEQTRGEDVDQRTDIWSFGVVLYEMLTRQMPFRGDYDQAIIYSIMNEEPQIEGIDPEWRSMITKLLTKNVVERYQGAEEIIEDLKVISGGGKVKRPLRLSNLALAVAGIALILFAIVFYLFMPLNKKSDNTKTFTTIAVLPFLDMSPNKDQEYFSDGLSEELLNMLAKNPKLRVTSRTSAFYFKGKDVDLKTIAKKLNVKHILEGSVRKSGNELRITADLVNVETDATLWSNIYNGTLNNIFALQDSISSSVVKALNITLLGKDTVKQYRETNPDAYNAYLLGNYFLDARGKENYEKAIDYYKKAISIDPKYAQAWVGLSSVHGMQTISELIPVDEGYRIARQEVEKALELDPNLASAHSRLGWIKLNYDWDWEGADRSYKKALKLDPGDAAIISEASVLSRTLGRLDEGLSLIRRSTELNPVSISAYKELGVITYYSGLYDESINAYKKVLELNSNIPAIHLFIGLDYLEKGKPDSALSEIMKENIPIMHMYGYSMVYYAQDKMKESDKMLADFIKTDHEYGAYQIAEVYGFRNDKDKAFEWLERAYDQRDGGLTAIKGDPLLHNIINDPRYTAFLKKLKLPL